MNTSPALPAVEHRVRVALAQAAAFDLFTAQIARWWPFRGHSCFGDEAVDVRFEPRRGGAVTEVARDGRRMPWGEITDWSPPQGFAMRWYPGLSAGEATLLQVRFVELPEGRTEVSVHHSGWESRGELAREKRDQYDDGWPATLAAYGACADPFTARSAT
jgi:uncharacterized protein YndB with AHSA1/START domain